jgi:type IV secretory pathway TraG/TraD family ATPase VirD4
LKDIDDFPKKFIDKAMLAFQHKLSFSRGYFFIGTVDNFKIGLRRMNRFLHILVGAPTGEGKSTSLIIPQLLFDADSIGSAVVPDAKSPDLFNAVAGRWLAKRKKAFLFAPWHKDTIAINFLPGADDQDLLTIVEVLMREREEVIGKEEAFFKARTKYLLFAIFKLAQTFTDEYCTMSTVYRMVESVSVLESFIEASSDNIKALFSDFHKLYSETKVNCLNAIREKIDICMDADVRKAFSKAEFKLGMLFEQKEPCLLVLGAPIDHKEAGTKIASLIINLIVNMAFRHRRIYKEAIQRGEQSLVPNDLYLYLDEIRNLKITALADLVAIAREIRTSVIVTTTDLGFFEYYRQDYSSLMGNLRTKLFMRGLDIESCQEISDMLGKENYINYRYMGKIMASQDEKNLLEPAQVMNLKEDKLVVFSPHTPPFIADKVSIYKSSWLEKMQVPAPREMRKLYKEWGVATEDLVDLPLPMTDGHYDVARMKSGKEPSISKNINVNSFEEKGGTTVPEVKKKETANYASEKKISKKSEGLDQEMAATQNQESK